MPPETRRDAFLRLAEARTNAVLDRLRVLGNCANPYAYEYTDEDIKRIFSTLEREVRATRAKFTGQRKSEFKLRP